MGEWGNHCQGSSLRENAHDSPPTEAEMGSQSGGQGSVDIGRALVDSSVPRVASTVSTAGMASRNMGEGSNHEDDSPGQVHSDGKHPGFGVLDRGNTGNSRADHVSDTNAGARVCMSKGAVP